MKPLINRIGESNVNSNGSQMVIVKYNNHRDVWVKFTEHGNLVNVRYEFFKSGNVKNAYDKTVFGIGYIGEGKYKPRDNEKSTQMYTTWHSMMQRCYSDKYQEKRPSYKGCKVNNEWHNFQNFATWYDQNYYRIDDERMNLDKDILFKGNKIYSAENCVFVPSKINNLFIKNNSNRGELPIGVSLSSGHNKYQSHGSTPKYHDTYMEAFLAYKHYKENLIKEVAKEYREQIPSKLYNAMMNYKVEITD